MQELLELITAGAYFPALALGLVLITHMLRKAGVDAMLARMLDTADARWLRPWIPMALASLSFAIAAATGAMDTAHAAAQSLAAAITAMAGHDASQAVLALLRAVLGTTAGQPPSAGDDRLDDPDITEPRALPPRASIQRRMRVAERVAIAVGASMLVLLGACVTPQSRPLSSYSGAPMAMVDDGAHETRAECRRMRDRSIVATAGGAAAGALASGLGGAAIPIDRDGVELSLGVASAVTAALGAGLALLATSYQGALDVHCSPWPGAGR
jgi:hypothetical protein